MNFIISQSDLDKNLQTVRTIINSKNTNPILDNFLFIVEPGHLRIIGSDGSATISTEMPLEASGSGIYAIPADKLATTIHSLYDQPLTFTFDNNQLRITAEKGKYNLPVLPGEDFPLPAEIENPFERKIAGSQLGEAISKTIFATANDELREVMNGLLFHFKPSNLNIVATDAHKLVRYGIMDIQHEGEEDYQYILPKKTMHILRNLAAKTEDDVLMRFSDRKAEFVFDNIRLSTTLIEGKYPQYEMVIPVDNPFTLVVDRKSFIDSLKRVTYFANQSTFLVELSLNGTVLRIKANNPEMASEAEEELTANYSGEDLSIGFNGRSLSEMLSALDSEEVEMTFSDPKRATLIRPLDGLADNEDILMLLMPIAL